MQPSRNHPTRNQHTIAASCEVRGRGYWSGDDVCVRIHPAPVNAGIQLVRTDLEHAPSCVANTNHVDAISFRTNLTSGDAKFAMVEHLLSALAGMEIDNALVEIDGEELPGLDGSARSYVESLQNAGLIIQAATKARMVIDQRIRVGNENGWVEAVPSERMETRFEYQLDYGPDSPISAATYATKVTPRTYVQQIAPARTFVTAEQAKQLQQSGVAQHVTNQDLLVFDEHGPVENTLRYPDECARHKLLDMVGDFALTGFEIVGKVISHHGGHVLNGMLAKQLVQRYSQVAQPQSTRRAA